MIVAYTNSPAMITIAEIRNARDWNVMLLTGIHVKPQHRYQGYDGILGRSKLFPFPFYHVGEDNVPFPSLQDNNHT
jgi:hypothetical protein